MGRPGVGQKGSNGSWNGTHIHNYNFSFNVTFSCMLSFFMHGLAELQFGRPLLHVFWVTFVRSAWPTWPSDRFRVHLIVVTLVVNPRTYYACHMSCHTTAWTDRSNYYFRWSFGKFFTFSRACCQSIVQNGESICVYAIFFSFALIADQFVC